jgi:hypothetical protein
LERAKLDSEQAKAATLAMAATMVDRPMPGQGPLPLPGPLQPLQPLQGPLHGHRNIPTGPSMAKVWQKVMPVKGQPKSVKSSVLLQNHVDPGDFEAYVGGQTNFTLAKETQGTDTKYVITAKESI